MKVEDNNIGDLVRIWGWGEMLVVTNIYSRPSESEQYWIFDAYGLDSRQMNELYFEQEEITIVSRAA